MHKGSAKCSILYTNRESFDASGLCTKCHNWRSNHDDPRPDHERYTR